MLYFIGGAEGIRTPGLVNASHALCQLSYSPIIQNAVKWYEIDFKTVKESTPRDHLRVRPAHQTLATQSI